MSLNDRRWCVAGSWISLALPAFFASGVWSGQSTLLLTVIGVLPPIIMLTVWKEPSRTIAEMICATGDRR